MNRKVKAQIYLIHGSQKAFAEKIGISELTVSEVVHNRKRLSAEEQGRWAQYLNTKREILFGDSCRN